jgi:SAM-dependent methyltransferase
MDVNDEQATLWNGTSGHAWVDAQAALDGMFQPFEDLLADEVSARPGGRILDVGCGTGSTTLAAARRAGATGSCLGIDISEPMIAAARARVAREGSPATFLCADAQSYAFAPASVDLMISRFGVMFFDDPVRAFANLRRAASGGAEVRFIAWRSPADNPFMTTAERAAAPLLPAIPPRRPDAPGQFAFADPHRVDRILDDAGWSARDVRPIDVACTLPTGDLLGYVTRLGPLGRVLPDADDRTRAQVIATVRPAFDPYVHGDEVRFTAACWMIGARAAP